MGAVGTPLYVMLTARLEGEVEAVIDFGVPSYVAVKFWRVIVAGITAGGVVVGVLMRGIMSWTVFTVAPEA